MTNPTIPSVPQTVGRQSSLTDQIAFNPYISKDELVNQLIREMINPNTALNQTYFVGIVTDIIQVEDKEIDVRDVFYSPTVNYERIATPISKEKQNTQKKILLVHIPSFITKDEISIEGSKLNYNSFNKIRVEYDRTEDIFVGNTVKIQFRDTKSFYNPFVVDKPINTNFNDISNVKNLAKAEFDKYLECKLLNIKLPLSIASIDYTSANNPAGGYFQALEEINRVFLPDYVDAFKKTISKQLPINLDTVIITPLTIRLSLDAYTAFGDRKDFVYFIKPLNSTNGNEETYGRPNYEIFGEEIIISVNDSNLDTKQKQEKSKEIKNLFYKFIEKDFLNRLGYTFIFNEKSDTNLFSVDMNLNLLLGPNAKKELKLYIDVSQKLKGSKTFYSFIKPPSPQNSANPQIIKSKTIADKCDSDIAKDKTVYELVYEAEKFETKGIRTSQNNLIKSIKDNTIKPQQFLTTEYFYKLFGTDSKNFVNFLTSKNSNFYNSGGITIDSYNVSSGTKNILNVLDLQDRFKFLINFLNQMRDLIIINEGYRELPDSIYILPFNVLEIKTTQINGNDNRDKNSRHFYGKAFDIMVFIRDEFYKGGKEKRVVQVLPEIVALYVHATAQILETKYTVGQGMFLEKTKFYNHVEFLDQNIGLTQEQIDERILFTGATTDKNGTDVEQQIEKIKAGSQRIEKLKEIVRQGSNYINPISRELDPRFEAIT